MLLNSILMASMAVLAHGNSSHPNSAAGMTWLREGLEARGITATIVDAEHCQGGANLDCRIHAIKGAVPPNIPVWLIGHSIGGEAAILAAEQLGTQVEAVVVLAPTDNTKVGLAYGRLLVVLAGCDGDPGTVGWPGHAVYDRTTNPKAQVLMRQATHAGWSTAWPEEVGNCRPDVIKLAPMEQQELTTRIIARWLKHDARLPERHLRWAWDRGIGAYVEGFGPVLPPPAEWQPGGIGVLAPNITYAGVDVKRCWGQGCEMWSPSERQYRHRTWGYLVTWTGVAGYVAWPIGDATTMWRWTQRLGDAGTEEDGEVVRINGRLGLIPYPWDDYGPALGPDGSFNQGWQLVPRTLAQRTLVGAQDEWLLLEVDGSGAFIITEMKEE